MPLADDGLSTAGEVKHAYEGWKYPDDWIVESFSQEGPKILKHGEYFHMILAEGGTAGPPTGHMIVSARSKSIHGPWENSPHNPIARALSAEERWWSKGHGTLVEGPDGRWFIVYHAYEKGFLTLGRQALLEPVEWTADGWVKLAGRDPARPIRKPIDETGAVHGFPFSGDFTPGRMGVQWSFYDGGQDDAARYRIEDGTLVLKGKGTSPRDASPLWFVAGDPAYEIEVGGRDGRQGHGGAARLLQPPALRRARLRRREPRPPPLRPRPPRPEAEGPGAAGLPAPRQRPPPRLALLQRGRPRLEALRHRMDVSGYHHNTAYDFLSLRPALYVSGDGEARFRGFRYRALP